MASYPDTLDFQFHSASLFPDAEIGANMVIPYQVAMEICESRESKPKTPEAWQMAPRPLFPGETVSARSSPDSTASSYSYGLALARGPRFAFILQSSQPLSSCRL